MDKIYFKVKKKNPKLNAPEYHLRTVEDIFKMVNRENYKRFLKDFRQAIETKLALQESINAISQARTGGEIPLKTDEFVWIDD